eukprot:1729295-Rhodomonas_salina.1
MARPSATTRNVSTRYRVHRAACSSSSWCFLHITVMLLSLSMAAENSVPDLQILEPSAFHCNPWWHVRGALSPYCTSLHLSSSLPEPKKNTTTNDKRLQSAEAAFLKIFDEVPELAQAFLPSSPIDLGDGSVGDTPDVLPEPSQTLPFGQLLPLLPTAPRPAHALNLAPGLDDRIAHGFGTYGHPDPIIPIHRGRQSAPASDGAQETCDLMSIVMEGKTFHHTPAAALQLSAADEAGRRERIASKSSRTGAEGAKDGRSEKQEEEEYGLSMLECIPLSLRQELDLAPPALAHDAALQSGGGGGGGGGGRAGSVPRSPHSAAHSG